MSGDSSSRRFDIVAETRRRWSEAEKLAIVTEASGPCTNISAIARRHGIKPALLFRWKKECAGIDGAAGPRFVPMVLPTAMEHTSVAEGAPSIESSQGSCPNSTAGSETIEIELAGGRRIWVGSNVDTTKLGRIIALLEGIACGDPASSRKA